MSAVNCAPDPFAALLNTVLTEKKLPETVNFLEKVIVAVEILLNEESTALVAVVPD